jgi:type I restriction enzyme S subunit
MLPEGWKEAQLGDLITLNPAAPKVSGDTEVSFIRMEDISESAKIIKQSTKTFAQISKNGYTPFCDDDVIVAKITPCFENGKGALAKDLKNGVAFGSTEFFVLRSTSSIDSQFLYYLTLTHEFRGRGENNMRGSAGQKRVPADFVRSFTFFIPQSPNSAALPRSSARGTAPSTSLSSSLPPSSSASVA